MTGAAGTDRPPCPGSGLIVLAGPDGRARCPYCSRMRPVNVGGKIRRHATRKRRT